MQPFVEGETGHYPLAGYMRSGASLVGAAKLLRRYHDATVATAWFELSLDLVKETPGFSPPVASRAFGYLGVTLYEALAPGLAQYVSAAVQANAARQG